MLPKINGLFRLTRDSELRYSQSGSPILKLGVAASEKYKDKETQCFLDVTAFGKAAEIISQYAGSKGTQIYLSGKIQTEQWTDNSGQKKSKNVMVLDGFDFVSNKPNNSQTNQGYQQQPQNYQQPMQQQAPQQQYQQPQQQQGYQQQAPQQNNVPVHHETIPNEQDIPF